MLCNAWEAAGEQQHEAEAGFLFVSDCLQKLTCRLHSWLTTGQHGSAERRAISDEGWISFQGSQSLLASSCFLQAGLEQVQQWIPQGAVEGYLEAESLPSQYVPACEES